MRRGIIVDNEHKSTNIEIIGIVILFPIISVGCSFGISYLEKSIGFFPSILLLLIILIFFLISVYIAGKTLLHIRKDNIDEIINKNIKNIQDKLVNNKIMNGIYKEKALALMEKTNVHSEIWLISPDLLTEINNGVYAGVVRDNLKKGTKYRYFIPHSPTNEIRVKMFQENCNNDKNLEIYYLTDDFFFLVPDVDFAIYEPLKSISDGKQGYMGLLFQGMKERFAVLMNNDFVDALASKLEECALKSQPKEDI